LSLRFLPNRKTGSLGPTDVLVVVLLATAVHSALIREGSSLTDAAIMVATIIGWSIVLDILGARVPFLRWVLHSDPVQVVRDGNVVPRNLRKEFMTEEEEGTAPSSGLRRSRRSRTRSSNTTGERIRKDRKAPSARAGRSAVGR
jgi:hypothetical protein